MSSQKAISINLEFYDTEGLFIQGGPIMVNMHIPIPSVGDEVMFHGELFKVKNRRFSYVVGTPDQFGDVKVVFTCDRA